MYKSSSFLVILPENQTQFVRKPTPIYTNKYPYASMH